MKKLGLIFLLGCIAFFGSCSDDDKDEPKPEAKDYAKEVAGRYAGAVDEAGNGGLQVTIGGETLKNDDAVNVVYSSKNKVNLELKDFKYSDLLIGDITLENLDVDGNDQVVNITSAKPIPYTVLGGTADALISIKSAKITGKKIAIDLLIDVKTPMAMEVIVKFDGELNNKSGEAKITEVKATHALLEGNASLNETEKKITLYIKDGAKVADLKDVVLDFKISDKATSNPTSGSKLNIGAGETTIAVTAEDGVIKSTYTIVTVSTYKTVYDMEEWVDENPYSGIDDLFTPAGGWGTSNIGAHMIESITGKFRNVTKTEDAHSGKYATKLETLLSDNEGEKFLGFMYVPVVTPASLFLGKFNMAGAMGGSPLMSTEFGVDFSKKPISLKGYYKYEAGKVFYTCDNPKEYQYARKDASRSDEGSINAVLYDVTKDSKPLTGVDVYTSDRLVARAEFNTKNQKDYAEFVADFKFEEGKSYDATKKYRIAIIASSSRFGDTFSGAPGSTLYVDDIEIVAE